jgi:N-methylhydantoinase B
MQNPLVDPISVEVIQNALVSFIREMRVTIIRTAFGPVIWETHDFSCGLLAPDGELLALSEDNPVHIVPTMYSVPAVRERFGDAIAPGDIFVINDPYRLGTHMNDVAHLYPFFVDDRLTFWIVVRVHYPDIGGMAAGSITPAATEVYQEGLFLPPLKIYDRGKPNELFMDLFFANVRVPDERRGDFMAVMGAFWTADKRLRQILQTFGRDQIIETNRIVRDRAELRMREAILALPERSSSYELNLDSNGLEPGWVPLRVTVEVRHRPEPKLVLDFSDSAPPVPGPMNGAPATAACSAFTAIKSFLDPLSQTNGGAFRPIEIITKPGTIFQATPPMAMCGSLDLGYRTMELVMGALAAIRPEAAVGDHSSPAHVYFPVHDPIRNRGYVFYEMPIGGTGAVGTHDGSDAVAGFERGDFARISSVEIWEHQVPFRAEENSLIPDSGGAGKFRGGLGMRRGWRLLEKTSSVSDLSEPCLVPGFGVLGGYGGKPSTCFVRRGNEQLWPGGVTGTGKATRFPLRQQDIVYLDKWGGGGYGDPLERDPDLVAEDFREGYISAESAQDIYGVVIRNGKVDLARTEKQRRKLASERVTVSIDPQDTDRIDNGTRIWEIGAELAKKLGVADGHVLECVNQSGAPLRGVARINKKLNGSCIPVGLLARKALQEPAGRIWIRPVPGVLYKDSA